MDYNPKELSEKKKIVITKLQEIGNEYYPSSSFFDLIIKTIVGGESKKAAIVLDSLVSNLQQILPTLIEVGDMEEL